MPLLSCFAVEERQDVLGNISHQCWRELRVAHVWEVFRLDELILLNNPIQVVAHNDFWYIAHEVV